MSKLAVIEATIVVLLMVGGVAYVSTFAPPSIHAQVRDDRLAARAQNLLDVLHDLPYDGDPCPADSELEHLLRELVSGDEIAFDRRIRGHLGPGVAGEATIWNGFGHHGGPAGSTLVGSTASLDWAPRFRSLFSFPTASPVSSGERLDVVSLALDASSLVVSPGDVVRVEVSYDSAFGQATRGAEGLVAVAAAPPGGDAWGQTLSWEQGARPTSVWTVSEEDAMAAIEGEGFWVTLRIRPPQGPGQPPASLPPGAILALHVPRDWQVTDWEADAWSLLSAEQQTPRQMGFLLTASRPESLLAFRVLPSSPLNRPTDVVTARLAEGGMGQATLLVEYPSGPEADLGQSVFLSTPYPIAAGSKAQVGVGFLNGGQDVVVNRVTLQVPGGYDLRHHEGRGVPLFADAPPAAADGSTDGAWRWVGSRQIAWEGARPVEAGAAAGWVVEFTALSGEDASTSLARSAERATASLVRLEDGFEHHSAQWAGSAGIFRHSIPAAAEGSPEGWAPGAADEAGTGTRTYEARVSNPSVAIQGGGEYGVAPVGSVGVNLQGGLSNSSLRVASRLVPVGGAVHVAADLQSLVTSLGGQGATDATLSLDLYAPPSRGCEPTASWARTLQQLPRQALVAAKPWDPDGLGLASVFVLAEDGTVSRISHAGLPVWSRPIHARPTALLEADLGAQKAILVADAAGKVHRLDARTGALAWSVDLRHALHEAADVLVPDAVASMALHPDGPRLLLGTSRGGLARLSMAGELLAARGPTMETGRILQVASSPSGEFVLTSGRLERLGPALETQAEASLLAGVGMAMGEGRLLVADGPRVLTLDPGSLEIERRQQFLSVALMTAAGDATGDGVADLAIAHQDDHVRVMDGRTGELAWSRKPQLGDARLDVDQDPVRPLDQADPCEQAPPPTDAYGFPPVSCTLSPKERDYVPLALATLGSGVAYAYDDRGAPRLAVFSESGQPKWGDANPAGGAPATLASGTWGAEPALVVGTASGQLHVLAQASGTRLASAEPTAFGGRFALTFPVPKGGFFGTHVLVATLSWTDAAGQTHAARLMDWFEVVGPDGRPVLSPTYRVVLVVQDLGDPLVPRR